MSTISDFGQKIGGARKDLWQDRGLSLSDLSEMTQNERVKYVVKDEIWKKPDYQKMKDSGIPVLVIYYIKTIRDACPTRPAYPEYAADSPEIVEERQEEYISFIRNIRDAVMPCESVEQMESVSGALQRRIVNVPGVNYKIIKAIGRGCHGNQRYLEREMESKQFLFTPEQKLLAPYTFIRLDPERVDMDEKEKCLAVHGGLRWSTSYYYYNRCGISEDDLKKGFPGKYVAAKRHDVVAGPFETEDIAKKFILGVEKGAKTMVAAKARKTRLSPPVLGTLVRKGPEDYRGWQHATGEMFLDTFAFHGGEFGNWLNDKERQANLNYGYDAFMDLARTLEIDETSISFDSMLSIAFGARGHGNALAHFEPLRCVINLTKLRGAGSLAHEWIHALDFYVGQKESTGRARSVGTDGFASSMFGTEISELMNVIRYEGGGYTKFYRDAKAIDKSYSKSGHGYWSSDVELLARAGAAYIKDKAAEKGIRNDYLTGHADQAPETAPDGTLIYTSPQGEERKRINKAFDAMFEKLKEKALLKRAE